MDLVSSKKWVFYNSLITQNLLLIGYGLTFYRMFKKKDASLNYVLLVCGLLSLSLITWEIYTGF
jgi:hypothetical protein